LLKDLGAANCFDEKPSDVIQRSMEHANHEFGDLFTELTEKIAVVLI
jgi:hypothetical protein